MNVLRLFFVFFVTSLSYGQIGRTVDSDSIIQLQTSANELSLQRKFNEALSNSQEALKYAIFIENENLVAESYRIVGIVYMRMQYKALAIENYKKSIPYYKRSNDEKGLMKLYNNIGRYFYENNEYEAAEKQLRKSLALSEKYGDDYSSIYSKYNLGQLFLSKKQYLKAEDCFERVIEYSIDNPNYLVKSNILQTAFYYSGSALFGQRKIEAAKKQYEKAISFCDPKNKNHAELLSLAYEKLAKVYAKKQDKEAELIALEKHIYFYELFSIERKDKTLSEIVLKYGLNDYEGRLENIENQQEEKETYIENYKKLTTILIIILIVLGLLTGVFYLNQRARIKTNALLSGQNRQLFEAKKQIENVSKIRSNFFSLISHELRTPLYAIIGMTNLLLLEKPEEYQERYLKSLKFSGEHLLAIINNILQMNKIEASKMKIIEENVDLRKCIKNVTSSVDFLVKENRNVIDVKLDENIPSELLGDSLKISQILFNLLDNAVRYNMEANIRLKINVIAETAETITLKFSIKDNGLGIPQQKKHIIFENLEKGIILSENNGYLDLGLGLTTVNNLLKVLKSRLHLRSVLGKGSEFYFELQLLKTEVSETADEDFENKIYHLNDLKILIVDDNAVNGLLTQKILERKDVETKVVHSGFSALDILDQQSFDLILMDMFMPKLNGLETIQKIRENDNDIPIILLTAMEISDAYAKVVDTKISGVITKPFEPELLYDKIEYVIHGANEE